MDMWIRIPVAKGTAKSTAEKIRTQVLVGRGQVTDEKLDEDKGMIEWIVNCDTRRYIEIVKLLTAYDHTIRSALRKAKKLLRSNFVRRKMNMTDKDMADMEEYLKTEMTITQLKNKP